MLYSRVTLGNEASLVHTPTLLAILNMAVSVRDLLNETDC